MDGSIPYESWPQDEHKRWIRMGHTFGRHVFKFVRERALEQAAAQTPPEQAAAQEGVDAAIGSFMELLDGYFRTTLDGSHSVQYVLLARVRDGDDNVEETFELAPGGDGLAMGFAGWLEGDFGNLP